MDTTIKYIILFDPDTMLEIVEDDVEECGKFIEQIGKRSSSIVPTN
ncbi:hypothetical protein KAW80_03835 [Candidatus Babeliales bacterium]|nr:hypothetical protein [Candidatus Babeliales bacterium]